MQEQRMIRPSMMDRPGGHHVGRSRGEHSYLRFRCVRCNHCVSPGMFTAEGWTIYKDTELCPDCQKMDSAIG
jgi:hypothetical protein